MSKQYTIQYDTDRLNPEYIGINQKYSKKKKQRKQIDQHKNKLETSCNKMQKTHGEIQATLNKKKHELAYLKKVRQRYLSDLKHKMEENEKNNIKLQQLRNKSYQARISHQRNLEEAIQQKYKEKKHLRDSIREQLNDIKKSKIENKQKLNQFYQIRWREQEQQKQKSKNKINNFYRKKNKFLLTSYRSMIHDQDFKKKKSMEKIDFLETHTAKIKDKIQKKEKTLKSIEDEIEEYKITSLQLKTLRSQDKSMFNNSRISGLSKASSRPKDLLLSVTQNLKSNKSFFGKNIQAKKKKGKRKDISLWENQPNYPQIQQLQLNYKQEAQEQKSQKLNSDNQEDNV